MESVVVIHQYHQARCYGGSTLKVKLRKRTAKPEFTQTICSYVLKTNGHTVQNFRLREFS